MGSGPRKGIQSSTSGPELKPDLGPQQLSVENSLAFMVADTNGANGRLSRSNQ